MSFSPSTTMDPRARTGHGKAGDSPARGPRALPSALRAVHYLFRREPSTEVSLEMLLGLRSQVPFPPLLHISEFRTLPFKWNPGNFLAPDPSPSC